MINKHLKNIHIFEHAFNSLSKKPTLPPNTLTATSQYTPQSSIVSVYKTPNQFSTIHFFCIAISENSL